MTRYREKKECDMCHAFSAWDTGNLSRHRKLCEKKKTAMVTEQPTTKPPVVPSAAAPAPASRVKEEFQSVSSSEIPPQRVSAPSKRVRALRQRLTASPQRPSDPLGTATPPPQQGMAYGPSIHLPDLMSPVGPPRIMRPGLPTPTRPQVPVKTSIPVSPLVPARPSVPFSAPVPFDAPVPVSGPVPVQTLVEMGQGSVSTADVGIRLPPLEPVAVNLLKRPASDLTATERNLLKLKLQAYDIEIQMAVSAWQQNVIAKYEL